MLPESIDAVIEFIDAAIATAVPNEWLNPVAQASIGMPRIAKLRIVAGIDTQINAPMNARNFAIAKIGKTTANELKRKIVKNMIKRHKRKQQSTISSIYNCSTKRITTSFVALCACLITAETMASSLNWQQQKCQIYETFWQKALDQSRTGEISHDFATQNADFIASGCTQRNNICPKSDQEKKIADALSLVMINAGASGTFLPFSCVSAR